MPDICDLADDVTEQFLAQAMANRAPSQNVKPTGFCHNCEAELSTPGQLYCDEDCEKDHRIRLRADSQRPR